MPMFSKESLDALRAKIDLVEVLSPYVEMKRSGATYKALCPFHSEKSPSFLIRRGDSHYHCFGCGAHGDAIAFLMNFLKLSFAEAVEHLAEKFGIALEYRDFEQVEGKKEKNLQREILQRTQEFFHFHLLHTDEGHMALDYLYRRGLGLDFIRTFGIGFSPKDERLTEKFFRYERFDEEHLLEVGLLKKASSGRVFPFFTNRIMFPISDVTANVIGFSARKIYEETFGGKYINTSETDLFKKSKVLFGLNYSRRQIVKQRKAIIVEGQIDCLRLIYEGLNYVVCPGGTAFAEGHLKELLKLGVQHVYLAFDGDAAGREAAMKTGQLFQKEGVEVSVMIFPGGLDPDGILQKGGLSAFTSYLEKGMEFIPFLVKNLSTQIDAKTPAGKNHIAKSITKMIGEWSSPLMVHEGMKQLAENLGVPEETLGEVERKNERQTKQSKEGIDADKILELDLLRWLILAGQNRAELLELTKQNLTENDFFNPLCAKLYIHILELSEKDRTIELLHLASALEREESELLEELLAKKVNLEKPVEGMVTTIQKLLDRNWMAARAEIQKKLTGANLSEEELFALAKEFDAMKQKRPAVQGVDADRKLSPVSSR